MFKKNWKKYLVFRKSFWGIVFQSTILLLLVVIIYYLKFADNYPTKKDINYQSGFFGITFSTKYCSELGLDWKDVYLAIIDDLKVKQIRLPIYWDEIEKDPGVYDFSDYDYIIEEGAKRDVQFIVNMGWRLPRWPECHAPEWATHSSLTASQNEAVNMVAAVVNHYKDEPAVTVWQLENEPFLDVFGVCPKSDETFFKRELETVRHLDNRPILVSASGELSFWNKEAKYGDIFGTTLYRVVWGKYFGYVRYPIPAWFYTLKAHLADIEPSQRYIVELQAEPWVPSGKIIYFSADEAKKSFNIEQFNANVQFSLHTKFNKAYLWGVEWWYYQYLNGEASYWEFAKTLFK